MPHPKFAARWTRALVSGLSGLTPDPADLDPPKIRWMPRAVMRAAGRMRSTLAPSVDDVPAGATFVLAFVLLDWLTFSYEWSRVGLTLWNPPPALSLGLLITRGLRTLPWVFIAALFAEVAVRRLSGGVTEGLVAAGTLTTGYGLLALFMTRWAGLDLLKVTPRDLGALLLIVPLGVLLIAVAHAQISVAVGALPREYGLEATLRFWIGDATGVLTTLPLILLLLRSGRSWLKELKMAGRDVGVFVAAVAGAQMLIFVTELPPSLSDETQYLYLLFPPIVWIAMRCGIAGAALGVFMIETGVFACAVVRGLSPADFQVYQLLAVFLSATGLLLGATITSGRNTEATLRAQREEMTRMNQVTAFGVMGSALAHELSQPLSSIAAASTTCQLLVSGSRPDPKELAAHLARIDLETERAGRTLRRIRDLATIDRNAPRIIALAPLVEGAVEHVQRAHGATSPPIQIVSEAPMRIVADPEQASLAIVNVIRNAIEATAAAAAPGAVTITLRRGAELAEIVVDDNGPGIAPELRGRLFEPYASTKSNGLGLGLAVAKSLIEMQGGRITLVDRPGAGARFVIRLPLALGGGP